MPAKPRPREQRVVENERYTGRCAAAGLVKLNVLVPAIRLPELDALLVGWRQEARSSLDTDQPTADQILLIHAICRARRIKLPIRAFATRYAADEWLRGKQLSLEDDLPHLPRPRRVV